MTQPVQFNKTYAVLIARTLDILLAGWIWRDYDITISSETGLAMRTPSPPRWARWLNAFLTWIETNHCELAIQADTYRAESMLALIRKYDALYPEATAAAHGRIEAAARQRG